MKKEINRNWRFFSVLVSAVFILLAALTVTKGNVYVEVESVNAVSPWELQTEKTGYSGAGYFFWTAGDNMGGGTGVLTYEVNLAESGKYVFDLLCRRDQKGMCEGEASDQCNDIFVDIGSGWSKKMVKHTTEDLANQIWAHWDEWMWDPSWDHGPDMNLSAGSHTIKIAGRSKGVKIDAFRMYIEGTTPPEAPGGTDPTCTDGVKNGTETGVDCGGSCPNACSATPTCSDGIQNGSETGVDCGGSCTACPTGGTCDEDYTYAANGDFTVLPAEGDYGTYYTSESGRLAIGPMEYPYKWARAELTFSGVVCNYDFNVTGVKEEDGETSYRVFVNDVQVGTTVQNDHIGEGSPMDMDPQVHAVATGIALKNGDKIRVESDTHSNEEKDEPNDVNNYAWARGRWTQLELVGGVATSVSGNVISLSMPEFSVMSSPFDGMVRFQFQGQVNGEFTIYSAEGKAVWSSQVNGSSINLSKEDVKSGIYTGVLTNGKQKISRSLVIF